MHNWVFQSKDPADILSVSNWISHNCVTSPCHVALDVHSVKIETITFGMISAVVDESSIV